MHFPLRTNYLQDQSLWPDSPTYKVFYVLLLATVTLLPLGLDDYYLGEFSLYFIYCTIGLSLILLTGLGGMLSLGHAAFLAIGAYSHCYFLNLGLPFPISILLVVVFSGLSGIFLSFSLRNLQGVYLSIATLAIAILIQEVAMHWKAVTGGLRGMMVPEAAFLTLSTESPSHFYFLCLLTLIITLILLLNLKRTPRGRAMIAIRDSELSGSALGISIGNTKTFAFAVSTAIAGVAGALLAHKMQFISPETYSPIFSIQLILMVVVGGLATFHGAFLGALLILQLPQLISFLKDRLPPQLGDTPGLEPGLFGFILIIFILYEPLGIYGRLAKIRSFFEQFPFYRKNMFAEQNRYLKTERVH